MNQLQRDKWAVRKVIKRLGRASAQDIALHGGEGLGYALLRMLSDGEIYPCPHDPMKRFQLEPF